VIHEWLHEVLDGGLSTFTIGVGLFCLLVDGGLLKAKRSKETDSFFIWIGAFYVLLGTGVWLYIIFH